MEFKGTNVITEKIHKSKKQEQFCFKLFIIKKTSLQGSKSITTIVWLLHLVLI